MAFEAITSAHRLTYQENVILTAQQLRPTLVPAFTFQPNMSGREAKAIDIFAADEAIIDGPRGGDTPHIEPRVEQVWMKPRQIEWGRVIEKEDTIKAAIDLQSTYVKSGAGAIVRGRENICAEAFFGPRLVGQDGTQTAAYSADENVNLVPVNYVSSGTPANSGLTFDKLAQAFTLLVGNEVEVEMEEIYIAVTRFEEKNLYEQVQFLSKDYREKTVVDDKSKRIQSFLGINFLRFQRLPLVSGSTTIRRVPLWCKSGMHFGEFSPLETSLERNPQKKYRLHPFMETWCGATRSEDYKVIDIRCDAAA